MQRKKPYKPSLLLDSGAFSVWRLGKAISLLDYSNFVHDHAHWIDAYFNLDCINPHDPEDAASRSFANWQEMRARGLAPIPVFHAHEHIKWLDKMLDAGATYIGIAPLSLRNRGEFDRWYDVVWNYLVTSGGLPVVKLHALGEGRIASILRYPWFSADSSTWIQRASSTAEARIEGIKLTWNTAGDSSESCRHVAQLSSGERAIIENFCAERGLNAEALLTDPFVARALRYYLEALHYKTLEASTYSARAKTWEGAASGLFGLVELPARNEPSIAIHRTKLYLVISPGDATQEFALLHNEYPQILCSYFTLRSKTALEKVKRFVQAPRIAVAESPHHARLQTIFVRK